MQIQTALVLPASVAMPAVIAPPVPLTSESALAPDTAAPLVLLGKDKSGKPHGARFASIEEAAVKQVADLMDFYLITADTNALRELAAKLSAGRLFASGKALVPFCSGPLYDQMLATAGIPITPRRIKAASKAPEAGASAGAGPGSGAGGAGAGNPPATRAGAKAPGDWSQIGLGSLVLAQGDEDDNEGYFVAKVIATKAGDSFVLTWTDYPDLPEFARSRKALALLHPETAAEVG